LVPWWSLQGSLCSLQFLREIVTGKLFSLLFWCWVSAWLSLWLPLTTVVMSSAGEEHFGAASGVNNAVARVAGVLAIAVFGIVVVKAFSSHTGAKSSGICSSRRILFRTFGRRKLTSLVSNCLPAWMKTLLRPSSGRSPNRFVSGYRLVLLSCAGLAAASTLVAWKLIASEEEIRKKP